MLSPNSIIMKKLWLLILSVLTVLTGCDITYDDYMDNEANVMIWLTDDPADYEAVLIEIQAMEVIYTTDDEEDKKIYVNDINYGVYNLLDFTNGMDTLLAEITVPPGHISQMRLVLGKHNSVQKNGIYYELVTPSAEESGLKFDLDVEIMEDVIYQIWIDFDAGSSVVELGNDEFILKPVISTYTEAVSGTIIGMVEPVSQSLIL